MAKKAGASSSPLTFGERITSMESRLKNVELFLGDTTEAGGIERLKDLVIKAKNDMNDVNRKVGHDLKDKRNALDRMNLDLSNKIAVIEDARRDFLTLDMTIDKNLKSKLQEVDTKMESFMGIRSEMEDMVPRMEMKPLVDMVQQLAMQIHELNRFLMLPPLEDDSDLDFDHNYWAIDTLRKKLDNLISKDELASLELKLLLEIATLEKKMTSGQDLETKLLEPRRTDSFYKV